MAAVDPVAFRIFNFEIRWYGILIAIALILGIVVAYFIAQYREQKADEVINFAPFAVIFGVIGARFLHVIVNWAYYSGHLSYIFAFRKGGLAIQGVMLGWNTSAACIFVKSGNSISGSGLIFLYLHFYLARQLEGGGTTLTRRLSGGQRAFHGESILIL